MKALLAQTKIGTAVLITSDIRCEVWSDDAKDPAFEFYQFRGGRLVMQEAKLVRGPPK